MWNLHSTHIIHKADNLMYSFEIIQSNKYILKVKNTFSSRNEKSTKNV